MSTRLLKIASAALLLLLIHPAQSNAQIHPRPGDNQLFHVAAVGGFKSHYPLISLERSLGNWSVSGSIGGGFVGSDLQQVLFSDDNFTIKHAKVANSKTLTELPNHIGNNTYMWKTKTQYMGAMMRTGINYYFGRQLYHERMTGFYTGLELVYMRTFEYQTVTYREKNGDKTWEYDGLNEFNTFAMSLKAGYRWYPGGNPHYCMTAAIARPFYIPVTEEINLSSPFTAAHWELEIGFGYRINAR